MTGVSVKPDTRISDEEGLFEIKKPREKLRKMTTPELRAMLAARYDVRSQGNGGTRYVSAPEVRNQAGFGWSGLRSCDLLVMDTWESGPVRLIGHELKVSRADWLHELADPSKAAAFTEHVAEWWLVIADHRMVRDGELPEGWGLLAPSGDKLRAYVKAARKPQEPIPVGMLAALTRSIERSSAEQLAEARQPRPHTLERMPFARVSDDVPRDGYRARERVEIQRPARRARGGLR